MTHYTTPDTISDMLSEIARGNTAEIHLSNGLVVDVIGLDTGKYSAYCEVPDAMVNESVEGDAAAMLEFIESLLEPQAV